MSFFADTSGFYALLVGSQQERREIRSTFRRLIGAGRMPVTTHYVILETVALLQSRFGLDAVRDFVEEILPLIRVHWVGAELHGRALARLLAADRRSVSLVDCASFALMKAEGIRDALALDRHFAEEGFRLLPKR